MDSKANDPLNMLREKVPRIGFRHVQSVLFFFYLLVTCLTRQTMSIAVVAMASKNSENPDVPVYDWAQSDLILSSFFWTYVILQLFSGYIFEIVGLRRLLFGTMLLNSIAFALIPLFASSFGLFGVVGIRLLQGLFQGFTYPAAHSALGAWAPPQERSKLTLMMYSGGSVGVMTAMLSTGYLSSSWYGWPLVFYMFGACGMIWCLIWFFLGYDNPAKHPWISYNEKKYIMDSLDHIENTKHGFKDIPLKAVLTSVPYVALIISSMGITWGGNTMDLEIPTYLSNGLGLNISKNGVISASPQITQLCLLFLIGPLSDFLVNKRIVSLMNCRRIFQFFGSIVPAAALIGLANVSRNQVTLVVFLLNFIVGLNSLMMYGAFINHVDLSPKYAGLLLGIENTFSMSFATTGPTFVQFVVTDKSDIRLWRYLFISVALLTTCASAVFMIFGSADVQWWNSSKKSKTTSNTPLTKMTINNTA